MHCHHSAVHSAIAVAPCSPSMFDGIDSVQVVAVAGLGSTKSPESLEISTICCGAPSALLEVACEKLAVLL